MMSAIGLRLPAYPGSLLFSAALNIGIAAQLPGDVRAALHGKVVRISVTDVGVKLDVRWHGQRFEAVGAAAAPDLIIGASARDFLLLAQRREDPDTLFFGRRLTMEGDTELGLLVKNTLDAIDLAPLDPARFAPFALLARFRRAVAG